MKTAKIAVTLLAHMGSDLSVVNAARVSFDKESDWFYDGGMDELAEGVLDPKDEKLISYLARHKHTSPFNHAFASFRVKAPIFVARQLVKHKFLPWNEVSRRYVDSEPEFWFPEDWRAKAENVKQGSSDAKVVLSSAVEYSDHNPVVAVATALDSYRALLSEGVCAEQARTVLPQNTMTEWVWSGSLGAFADMCRLRLDPHAQKESQEVAQLIANEMKQLYPVSWSALLEN